ncbi:MAG: restriction endonuclease subunit S, partial [Bacteroidales bacterium]|nr:restriction endonuclease subunit S [Bacteroidales bacterium]
IQWIGDIPDDWEVTKIGQLYQLRNQKVSDRDYPPLSVTMNGIVPQMEHVAKTNAHDDRKLVKKGDFAINSRSDRRGSCGISKYDGSVSLINTVLQPLNEMNPNYYDWLFHTVQFADEFYKWGHGIVDDLWSTNWQDMKNISVCVPPLATQTSIATYLDAKCSEIDGLIADINKQIETLNELKKSTITEVVTKGLNKNAKLKDSGIQWIGMIPEGWSVSRVKYLLIERKNFSIYGEEEPLSMSQKYGLIPTSEMENVPHQAATLVGSKIANVGDLVFNKLKAHLGVFSVSKYYGLVSPDYAVYYSNGKSDVKYLEFLFKTQLYISQFKKLITGVGAGLSRLYTSDLFSIYSIYPPLAEQQSIATYLDTKCTEFDSIISDKQKQISTLEAYKKSLIYEYVTGKTSRP